MIFLQSVLFFLLISSTLLSGADKEFYDKENEDVILSQHIESEDETDPPTEDCDRHTCKKKTCNCCPGYGVRSGNILSSDTCRKCNCGQLFSCSYTNWDTKTCYCDTGYTDVSGICIADCKENPCKNGGTCTIKNYDVFCVCKEPYTGKLCDEDPEILTTSEDTTAEVRNGTIETTDLVINNDTFTTTEVFQNITETLTDKESFENITSNYTFITTESFENLTLIDTLFTTDSFTDMTSDSTKDTNITEAPFITSSAKPDEEIIITTSGPNLMIIALIAVSATVVLLILMSAFMAYRHRNKR